MEETLTPDIVINKTTLTVNGKEYSFYCRRLQYDDAKMLKEDLAAQGHKAIIKKKDGYYEIWWRR